MFIKKSKIDKMLNEDTEGNDDVYNKDSMYLIIFYASIIITIFVVFIKRELFLLTLFGPTVIFFIIKPPTKGKILFRFLSLIYFLFLVSATVLWYVK